MLKRIFFPIILLLIPIFFYSCGTVKKTELTDKPTVALVVKSESAAATRKTNEKVALIVKSESAAATRITNEKVALIVKSAPDEEFAKKSDIAETVEEKVFTYKSEVTEEEAIEADVLEAAEVAMEDLPAVTISREPEAMALIDIDPYGPQRIYSIQTASLKEIAHAQRYFQFLMKEFHGSPVEYARIEKIGIYYAVRIGKFNGYTAARRFLADYQPLLSSAIIVDNYPHKLIEVKKGLDRDGPEKIYAVQTASFEYLANARNHYKSMIKDFNGKGVDYVRLVKVGKYYAVRLGKFDGYTVAKTFLHANPSELSSAIILDNYPVRKVLSTYSYLKN